MYQNFMCLKADVIAEDVENMYKVSNTFKIGKLFYVMKTNTSKILDKLHLTNNNVFFMS